MSECWHLSASVYGSQHKRILKVYTSESSVWQILHGDCDRKVHVHFCHQFLELMAGNPNMPHSILMSDDAHFHLHSTANNYNFWYWASEKLEELHEHLLYNLKVLVWWVVSSAAITGPIFWNMKVSKLSQSCYIPMLTCLKHFSCQGYRMSQVIEIYGFQKTVLWATSEN